MEVAVAGAQAFVHTGGVPWAAPDAGRPAVVLLHGAANDHSVFRYQTRLLAALGYAALAPDLPGHSRSQGPACRSIRDYAEWVLGLLDAVGAGQAVVVGHSMGALIAVECAAAAPSRVRALVAIGSSAQMQVHPELQAAADARDPLAVDLVVGWGHSGRARLGGHQQAGVWNTALDRRLTQRNLGVLGVDLRACAEYAAGDVAAGLDVPALVIAGEKDRMTPASAGHALAKALGVAPAAVIAGAAHSLVYDEPEAVNALLLPFLEQHCR